MVGFLPMTNSDHVGGDRALRAVLRQRPVARPVRPVLEVRQGGQRGRAVRRRRLVRAASTGSPIIERAVAWIDCEVEHVYEMGDHFFVLGRVVALDADRRPRRRRTTPAAVLQGHARRVHIGGLTDVVPPATRRLRARCSTCCRSIVFVVDRTPQPRRRFGGRRRVRDGSAVPDRSRRGVADRAWRGDGRWRSSPGW